MGKCGKMWEDMRTVAQKVSDQFSQSIFSENNLALVAYYFEVTTKNKFMRFNNCECWEMWENVGKGRKVWRSLAKQTIWEVGKQTIINRKLPFSAHYFEVTIKSISARSANCGLWGIWGNVARCGEIWGTFAQKLATNFVSQYSARII